MAVNAENIKTSVIKWLLEGNLSFQLNQDAIGAEVLFSKSKRRADLLIYSKHFHALEIKGDFDNFTKLAGQLADYHRTFDKVSLVVTSKHLAKAKNSIKRNTGIILLKDGKLRVLKVAKKNKRLSRLDLLAFLNKREMVQLFKMNESYKLSTDELRTLISKTSSTHRIHSIVFSYLKDRYCELFRLFHKDVGDNFLWDELKGLCGRISDLRL